jgi:hypothetical protein
MDIDYIVKNFLHNYDLFIEQLAYVFTDDEYKEYLTELNMESKDKKWERGQQFADNLNEEYFDLFLEQKMKLFANKDLQLFDDKLSLKKIFNNRDNSIKSVLWSYLHLMVLMSDMAKRKEKGKKDRIKKLSKVIEENVSELEKNKEKAAKLNKSGMSDPKNIIKNMLNVDVNDDTNEMISDIVKSFETTLDGNSNPFSGILNISQQISSKYANKINTGEIQLGKLMEGIQKTMPGMDKVFKAGESGDPNDMKGMMDNILGGMAGGLGGLSGDMAGMGDMLGGLAGGLFNKEKEQQKVIIDENFSTSKVDLGQIKESKSMNIGKLLNVADTFGVIPGGKKKEGSMDVLGGLGSLLGGNSEGASNSKLAGGLGSLLGGNSESGGGLGSLLGGNANMGELFNMMGSLNKDNNSMEDVKNKMDTFLEQKLGLDVKKINEDLENLIKSKKLETEKEE